MRNLNAEKFTVLFNSDLLKFLQRSRKIVSCSEVFDPYFSTNVSFLG